MRIAGFSLALVLTLAGCKREERSLRDQPARSGVFTAAIQSELQPGGKLPRTVVRSPFEGNAAAIAEGKRLYGSYNCSGCHFQGGGGIGPPLTRPKLIYGLEPENIFDTINKGRPNGMPSWGGRIPESQIWQIVAYVRSLSGNEPAAATSGRSDHLEKKTAAQLQ